jgi:Zn-dependent protease
VRLDAEFLIPRLIAVAMILLISFPVHEFAHALAAYRLGDGTAKLFGRLTLNPIAHFDPFGGLLLVISSMTGFGIGWAKPTPVNPSNLRGGRDSEGIVAFAGPASNLVLAALGAIPLRLLLAADESGTAVPSVILNGLFLFIVINVALMIFNLVPIPPLDGSKVLFSMLSPRQVYQWRPVLEQYGFLILIVVAFVPILPGGETLFGFVFVKVGSPIVSFLIGRGVTF